MRSPRSLLAIWTEATIGGHVAEDVVHCSEEIVVDADAVNTRLDALLHRVIIGKRRAMVCIYT